MVYGGGGGGGIEIYTQWGQRRDIHEEVGDKDLYAVEAEEEYRVGVGWWGRGGEGSNGGAHQVKPLELL